MAQSVSILVPANNGRCINNCKTCCVKMHIDNYKDKCNASMVSHQQYIADITQRLIYTREKGCDVLMITGSTEPQQNRAFLEELDLVNRYLPNPFKDIEMQTTGAFIDTDMLRFLHRLGVKTMAISLFCLDSDDTNREIIQTPDKNLCLEALCKNIKEEGMSLRLCLNMTDHILTKAGDLNRIPERIFIRCMNLDADQITFRKMWAPDTESNQDKYINGNCQHVDEMIEDIKKEIKTDGRFLNTLEYGAKRYAYGHFSTVIDEDSMAQDASNNAIKYYVIRQDGKIYSNWDSPASLIF